MPTPTGPIRFTLTRRHRLIIMGSLITSFFVISPLIILYTAGFRYDWQDKTIKTTGVLSIDIAPDDASVYANDILIKKTIPIRLTNLAPGTTHIRISKPGFHTWEKDLSITSNQTTFIKNVTLFKDSQPQIEKNTSGFVANIWTVADEKNAIVIVERSNTTTTIKKNVLPNTSETTFYSGPTTTLLQVSISPAHDRLAMIISETPETQKVIVQTLSQPIIQTTTTYSTKSLTYQWSKNTKGADFYVADGHTVEALSPDHPRFGLGSITGPLWYVDQNQAIWIVKDKILTTSNQVTFQNFISVEKPVNKIIDVNNNRSIFAVPGGLLTITRRGDAQETKVIPSIDYSYQPDTKEWWVWSRWELASIYDSGDTAILNRSSEPITIIRPLDTFGLNLVASATKISGFNPGYYVSQDLAQFTSIQTIDVDEKNRIIYIAGSRDNQSGIFSLVY